MVVVLITLMANCLYWGWFVTITIPCWWCQMKIWVGSRKVSWENGRKEGKKEWKKEGGPTEDGGEGGSSDARLGRGHSPKPPTGNPMSSGGSLVTLGDSSTKIGWLCLGVVAAVVVSDHHLHCRRQEHCNFDHHRSLYWLPFVAPPVSRSSKSGTFCFVTDWELGHDTKNLSFHWRVTKWIIWLTTELMQKADELIGN